MTLSLSLGLSLGARAAGVDPIAALFANGEEGAWWDNQDLSTLFSDAAMTMPATVDGEVLGQTDKSGNGRHRTQTTPGSGPILRQRSDGVYYLDYAGGKTLSVPSSTALFKYLHDGTGGTLLAFMEWHQGASDANYIVTGAFVAEVGISIYKSGSSETVSYSVFNGSGVVGATSINRCFLSSAPRMVRFSVGDSGVVSSVDSSRTAATASATSPNAASASRNFGVVSSFNGFEYNVVCIARELTSSELTNLWAYMRQQDYPVPNVDLTLILGGQSNMSGRGTVVTTAAAERQVGVYSYTKAEEFRIARIPEHSIENRPVATTPDEPTSTAPQHGFAMNAGKALKDDAAQDVLLVPCAIGSTSIADWDTPLTSGDRSSLFGALVYRYQQATAKGGAPVIVWYGHEGSVSLAVPDYTNGGVGTAYQTAFASLISNIRQHTSADAPLIFVQLASDDDLAQATLHAGACEAQRQNELSITNAYMVVAHDVPRNASPDDIHVSRAGMDTLGERVALAIREHVLGEAVNGTGPRIVGAAYSGSTITLTCDKAVNTTAGDYGDLFRVYADGVEQTVSSANRGSNTSTVEIVCSAPLSGSVTLTYGYRAGPASAARTDFVADADGLPLPLFGPLTVTA